MNNALSRRVEAQQGEPIRRTVRRQSPLQRLFERKTLTEAQYLAGDRLSKDFELAACILGPAPVRAASLELRPKAPLNREISEAQVGRVERYRRAVEALPPQLRPVVLAVACHEQTVSEWSSCYAGVSRHFATGWLIAGLEILADSYGLLRRGRRGIPIDDRPPAQAA